MLELAKIKKLLSPRLSRKRFSGLPLSILAVTMLCNIMLLADGTEDIINSQIAVKADDFVAKTLFKNRNITIAEMLYVITQACSRYFTVSLSILFCAYYLYKKKAAHVFAIIIAILGSGISVYMGKMVFKINRPMSLSFYSEATYSFPSGHATSAVALYGLLFYLALRKCSTLTGKTIIVFIAFVFFGVIGFSRLYLCVHFLSDVLIGYLLGSLWLLLAITFLEWRLSLTRQLHSTSEFESQIN